MSTLYNTSGNISLLCNTVKAGQYLVQVTLSYIISVSQLHIIPYQIFFFQGRSYNNVPGNCINSHMPVYMLKGCILKCKYKHHGFFLNLPPKQTNLYIQCKEAAKLTPYITNSSQNKILLYIALPLLKNPLSKIKTWILQMRHFNI